MNRSQGLRLKIHSLKPSDSGKPSLRLNITCDAKVTHQCVKVVYLTRGLTFRSTGASLVQIKSDKAQQTSPIASADDLPVYVMQQSDPHQRFNPSFIESTVVEASLVRPSGDWKESFRITVPVSPEFVVQVQRKGVELFGMLHLNLQLDLFAKQSRRIDIPLDILVVVLTHLYEHCSCNYVRRREYGCHSLATRNMRQATREVFFKQGYFLKDIRAIRYAYEHYEDNVAIDVMDLTELDGARKYEQSVKLFERFGQRTKTLNVLAKDFRNFSFSLPTSAMLSTLILQEVGIREIIPVLEVVGQCSSLVELQLDYYDHRGLPVSFPEGLKLVEIPTLKIRVETGNDPDFVIRLVHKCKAVNLWLSMARFSCDLGGFINRIVDHEDSTLGTIRQHIRQLGVGWYFPQDVIGASGRYPHLFSSIPEVILSYNYLEMATFCVERSKAQRLVLVGTHHTSNGCNLARDVWQLRRTWTDVDITGLRGPEPCGNPECCSFASAEDQEEEADAY